MSKGRETEGEDEEKVVRNRTNDERDKERPRKVNNKHR